MHVCGGSDDDDGGKDDDEDYGGKDDEDDGEPPGEHSVGLQVPLEALPPQLERFLPGLADVSAECFFVFFRDDSLCNALVLCF